MFIAWLQPIHEDVEIVLTNNKPLNVSQYWGKITLVFIKRNKKVPTISVRIQYINQY